MRLILSLCITLFVSVPIAATDAVNFYRQGLRSFEKGDTESVRESIGFFRRAI